MQVMMRKQVNKQQVPLFQIKGQVSVFRHNLLLNPKRKTKFSNIILNPASQTLSVCSFSSNLSKQQQNYVFQIKTLRNIHRKYVAEGKITLQFYESKQHFKNNSQIKEEPNSQIFIQNGSKENLQLLISKIIQIKNKNVDKKKDNPHKDKNKIEINESRKLQTTKHRSREMSPPDMISKKRFKQIAMLQPRKISKLTNEANVKTKKIQIDLFKLPADLVSNIFSYVSVTLNMRLVSRSFNNYVLKNIINITLKDDISEPEFNKLAKWAINVQCRMKNIKELDINDRYDSIELVKNRAKTLKFSNWKQITIKNILQLKNLRLYCLQIPYSIKFQFINLLGLKLVQLRLKGNKTNKNSFVKDEDIIRFITICKTLKVLQVSYAQDKLLTNFPRPQTMQQLKIGTLNIVTQNKSWSNFTHFQNLRVFSIEHCLIFGLIQDLNVQIQFPKNLVKCQIGSYIHIDCLSNLPQYIQSIKLIGDKFYNNHIQNLCLRNLKFLDISETRYISSDGLNNLQETTILTNWQRETVLSTSSRYSLRNLTILSIRR